MRYRYLAVVVREYFEMGNVVTTRVLPFSHVFCIFMKITTKSHRKDWSQKCPNFAFVRVFRVKSQIPYSVLECLFKIQAEQRNAKVEDDDLIRWKGGKYMDVG